MKRWGFFLCFFIQWLMNAQAQVFNIRDFGANPGSGLQTAFIQAAIDSAANAGGGIVYFPEGVYLSSTLFLKDNVTLEISKGATLKGAPKVSQYPEVRPIIHSYGDKYPGRSLIYAEGKTNIGIIGEGTIDGNGTSADFLINNDDKPFGIRFISCKNVRYENITLKNSGFWMMHNLNCDSMLIRNVTITNHCYGNNDGLSLDGCRNVLIENCNVDSNNDPVVIKTMSVDAPAENIEVRNCTLATYSRAIKVGTETYAPVKNVHVHDCVVKYSTKGPLGSNFPGNCGILLSIVDGGSMENVVVENIAIKGVNTPILIRLGNRGNSYSDTIPPLPVQFLRNVRLENIDIEAASAITSSITGIPGFPLQDITLKNIQLTVPGGGKAEDANVVVPENISGKPEHDMFGEILPAYGLFIRHVQGLVLENVCISTKKEDARPEIYFEDTAVVNILPCGITTALSDKSLRSIAVYPNPAANQISILLPLIQQNVVLECTDISGKIIFTKLLTSSSSTIDISSLASGFYLLTIKDDNALLGTGKFQKY